MAKKSGKEKAQIVFKPGANMLTDVFGVDAWKGHSSSVLGYLWMYALLTQTENKR
jgi:hypothetical protein